MRWYVNEASLQAQFANPADFVEHLKGLLALRQRFDQARQRLYVTRSFSGREVRTGLSLAQLFQQPAYLAQRKMVLSWLTSAGPFMEEARTPEPEDYFECEGHDVTDGGLGEGTRRLKCQQEAGIFSFPGGETTFEKSPLTVHHGLLEERLGSYSLTNHWSAAALQQAILDEQPSPTSWRQLVEFCRLRFPHLLLPDAIYTDERLAREAFDSVISERTVALLQCLDTYMAERQPDGSESRRCQEVIDQHFSGDRASFSGESETNRAQFKKALTFKDPTDPNAELFAHWHGKISHRYFRLHFEWPVPTTSRQLKVVYLGPKLTKS